MAAILPAVKRQVGPGLGVLLRAAGGGALKKRLPPIHIHPYLIRSAAVFLAQVMLILLSCKSGSTLEGAQ
jgi:hypothetical protein